MVLITKDTLIVIADDDIDDQLFFQHALQRNSFEGSVACVGDGNRLLEYLQPAHGRPIPSLIVLDLNMPFKDGYQALTEIKQHPLLHRIPIAVFTSSSRAEDESECYKLGCEKFYRKPLSIEGYDEVVSDMLNTVR